METVDASGVEDRGGFIRDDNAVLTVECLLPEQFFGIVRSQSTQPERNLCIAVLEDAIRCYQNYQNAQDPNLQKLYMETRQWICAYDWEWPFSFNNVCDALGINPDRLRDDLLSGHTRRIGRLHLHLVR